MPETSTLAGQEQYPAAPGVASVLDAINYSHTLLTANAVVGPN